MLEKLKKVIKGVNADFVDIRYEIKKNTRIQFNRNDLKEAGNNTTDGYVVRTLKNGGFGTATVTRPEDINTAIKKSLNAAEVISKVSTEKIELATAPIVTDNVKVKLDMDPREISFHDKVKLTQKYNSLVLNQPEIVTTNFVYGEVDRQKFYVNSSGTAISEEVFTTWISGEIVAGRNGIIQSIRVSIGSADGMKNLLNRDDEFLKQAGIAKQLLDAEPVKGGTYNVVLDPGLTGVFTHEAFGHFSEADIIENNPSLRKKMSLGATLGSEIVNIIADSTMPDQTGFYRYDDEGVKVIPMVLMEKGILKGRLHSRRTAASFKESITGHCIAQDYRFAPIVRMGTIFIKPGDRSLEELLKIVDNGLLLCRAKGGQTAGENFTFGAQYGYIIENGKLGSMVRDINIMGNLFSTLKNITAIGKDFKLSERGGCGKGQLNIKSIHGGPHIMVRDMVVGGV